MFSPTYIQQVRQRAAIHRARWFEQANPANMVKNLTLLYRENPVFAAEVHAELRTRGINVKTADEK